MSETKDIVERLRGHVTAVLDRFTDDASLQKQFYIANRNLKTEAADEITRLRSLLQEAVEALEPFSTALVPKYLDDVMLLNECDPRITVGDVRKARAVLAKARGTE